MSVASLLLPEFNEEMRKTRVALSALPEGHGEFKPHDKSMPLGKLAGHTAQMAGFISLILTTADLDLGLGKISPLLFETKPPLLGAFDDLAEKALTDLSSASDAAFEQNWNLTFKGHPIFSGTRFDAYRAMGMNHMIHHRAQLGVYLRLLNQAVPGTYGPSADAPSTS